MASYLARQIRMGRLDYDVVVKKFPQFKEEIDRILGKTKPVKETPTEDVTI